VSGKDSKSITITLDPRPIRMWNGSGTRGSAQKNEAPAADKKNEAPASAKKNEAPAADKKPDAPANRNHS